MLIALPKLAPTTPRARAQIVVSDEQVAMPARRYGVAAPTIYKCERRPGVQDWPHTAHRLQTTLTPGQGAIVVYLRRAPDKPAPKAFKTYLPGCVHVDVKHLPQMAHEDRGRYLFVAIYRTTRWVYVALKPDKSERCARAFVKALCKACPVRTTRLLSDNGTEFTDRPFSGRARAPNGMHEFDRLCQELCIEHRLTPPRRPQTNGEAPRFNGRIADLLRTHYFRSSEDLERTLHRHVTLYNHQLFQQALNAQTLVRALQDRYASKPELFLRKPSNRPGRDSFAQWVDLFTEDGLYWVPSGQDGPAELAVALIYDTTARLRERLTRMGSRAFWAQQPPTQTTRLVGNVLIEPSDGPELVVECRLILTLLRRHRQALLSGAAHYRLQPAGDSFRIRQKVVTLQERDEALDNPTFLI